jgi:hypothetical protein
MAVNDLRGFKENAGGSLDEVNLRTELLPLDGGTMTGSTTLGENADIILDSALSAAGKYTGIAIPGTAGTTLAFGDLVHLQASDGRWELADANVVTAAAGDARSLLGICVLAAAADASATRILLFGTVRASVFPTGTVGAVAYVGETAGDIVVTQPSTAGVAIRPVGHFISSTDLFFNPDARWTTHS